MGFAIRDRERQDLPSELLDALGASDASAFAVDNAGRIVFWSRGAEQLFERPAAQALGRRCCEVISGRDSFGNRYCHDECTVLAMARKGEAVHGFEISVNTRVGRPETLGAAIVRVPGERPGEFTLVHLLDRIDERQRLAHALERLGDAAAPAEPAVVQETLTAREREILECVASGLQNKEIAGKLGISLATVRNHVHNVLEKLGLHSKLEAVSLAFRRGWVARR